MNPIYKPMLAKPMSKGVVTDWNDWAIEEKFDGHRLLVHVGGGQVEAFTRPRRHAGLDGKTMAKRELPEHLVEQFLRFPNGVYDGELMGGETSTDVTRTDLRHTLRFVMFDVLNFKGETVTCHTWDDRREILEGFFEKHVGAVAPNIALASPVAVSCEKDVTDFVRDVWARGGEGAILKRRKATYQCGKRSADFIKVKKSQTAVLTVTGFEPTRGKVLDRGQFATLKLRDDRGTETAVKVPDYATLEMLEKEWKDTQYHRRKAQDDYSDINTKHPRIGTRVRIDYQDWTPKGGYRHPMFDRWEDE